ncbi:MAG: hypothetical protein J7M26_07885, partial [Armatimonadetes bacterium]|nr:hypothetical protein [Armatimonadota bacterium]
MRTLKVTLGVGVVGVLLATSAGWLASSRILSAGGDFYVGPERAKFVSFIQDRFGGSRRAAVAFMHQAAREQGAKIIDRFNLPPGALVDFIEVDGTKGPKPEVRFLGTGRVFPALSAEGIAFWKLFERAARKHGWKKAYRAMRDLRRRGVVITPAWFGGGTSAAQTGARLVNTAATQATSIRVAVICARFPAWEDKSPQSDGDTDRFDGDVYYQPDPTGQLRNVDPNYDETHGWDFIDWYIDSPGGRLDPAGGVPLGTEVQWNDTHPERAPSSYDGPTVPKVQEYWYKRMFDLNFTGASSPPWASSLRNYYWANSHGNVNITGQRTDIYGWVESHHILDRLPYPQGPASHYMVQPGTPLIRPSQEIINADGVDREILRASLTQDKLTILYKREFLVGSPPVPTLETEVEDAYNASGVDAPGWVQVKLSGHTTVIPDPYDRRRWTYVNDGWVFDSLDPDPDDRDEMDWNCWPGRGWRVTTTVGTGYTWKAGEPGYKPQDQGCGPLPNTLFTSADVLGSAPGNRLKSFDYYCHDHFVDTSRGPYQIEHLYHNGYVDDIGGDEEPASARKPRAYPFDCGLPEALGGSDRMQFGFFHYPNNDNQGGHSAAEMRADVMAAMQDMGLALSGTYDRLVFVFAGSGLSEGGGGSAGNWGTIIAHAGGNIVTVSEDVGLVTMAHEFGHTFGMVDLYDNDFYTNALSGIPPNPKKFECNGLGPYSVMAHGVRVDAWHLIKLGWLAADRIV